MQLPRWWNDPGRRMILPPRIFQRAPNLVFWQPQPQPQPQQQQQEQQQQQQQHQQMMRVGGMQRRKTRRPDLGCARQDSHGRCLVRFRGYNLRRGNRGRRPLQVGKRGWYRFRIWNTDWTPLIMDDKQLIVSAENSNSGAKKVVSALKQAGVVKVGDPDYTDFYMTSRSEVDPDTPQAEHVFGRTRFYHYEGRFIPRRRTVKRLRGRKVYQVEGVAEVQAFEGERFSVPFVEMNVVKAVVRKVLSGEVSIRAIQRQSMIYKKSKQKRNAFIQYLLGNAPNPANPADAQNAA
jgi:hypothetical protein